MVNIKDKKDCCGCTACASACPQKCIKMIPDEEGFWYPQVNMEACKDCYVCENVCPVLNPPQTEEEGETRAYVARSHDDAVLMSSSSGGFFSALCHYVLERGGCVFGAAFDENFQVRHICIERESEIPRLRGSKYVQSDLQGVFETVRSLLKEGKLVCFSGTACQAQGLKSFLKKDYPNLILVDLVCHGVPSPLMWNSYLDAMTQKYQAKPTEISFRDKTLGYQTPMMRIKFDNGKNYAATGRIDPMLKTFFSHITLRYSCFHCPAKGCKRCSDITLYDCWNVGKLKGCNDDNRGYTSILVHTEKGREIMRQLQDSCMVYECGLSDILPANGGGMVVKTAVAHKDRNLFYPELQEHGLNSAVQLYLPITFKDKIAEKAKVFLAKTGILQVISKNRRIR